MRLHTLSGLRHLGSVGPRRCEVSQLGPVNDFRTVFVIQGTVRDCILKTESNMISGVT